jgi:hypothetical protein
METHRRYSLSCWMPSFSSMWSLYHIRTESTVHRKFNVNTTCVLLPIEYALCSFDSSVRIIGLDPDTDYQIRIYAEHMSTQTLSKSVDILFTTERASKSIDLIVLLIERMLLNFSFQIQYRNLYVISSIDVYHSIESWLVGLPMSSIFIKYAIGHRSIQQRERSSHCRRIIILS